MSNIEDIVLNPKNYIDGSITPPGSKSITNRLLLLSSLTPNKVVIKNHLLSEDSEFMIKALNKLNVAIDQSVDSLTIHGISGNFTKKTDLFLGNAGTAFRPLCAVLSLSDGEYNLDGIERMHERPIKDLVNSVSQLGAQISYLKNDGFPPVKINPIIKNNTSQINIKGSISSQFLTGLLMAAPMLNKDIEIIVDGDLISKPYIDITLSLLKMFNITYTNNNYRSFKYIFSKENTYSYNKKYINVEPDASSASYFFAAAAISGSIEVKGLNQASIQGDIKFLDFIKKMGAQVKYLDNSIKVSMASELLGGEFDCIAIPDAAMTIAVMALFAKSPVKLINIKSWKVKETDRIIAMKNELEKFGAFVLITENTIEINPPQKIKNNVKVETYNDHRIAMCFSLTCLAGVTTIIHDPECVKKTYPNYFKDFLSIVK